MVAIVIIAAIITPTPDGFTLCLLALPMIVLYEISIWIAWYDARIKKKTEAMEEKERLERILNSSPPARESEEVPERSADDFIEPEIQGVEESEEPNIDDKPNYPEKPE